MRIYFMKSFYTRLLRLIDRLYPFFFTFLTLMTAFLCFRCLGIKAIDSWDEARHGISAYEMLKNGNFLVNTYLNEPDYWNVKPPVSFWSIMAGFTLFGYTSVGLRFFSALAYLITTVVTGLFARRYGKLTSLLVMAFLCANYFPFKAHLVRAGDADSLYLLFFTLAMLAMLKIRENGRMLYVCGLCFSLAFLTKSFHAGMIAAIGGLFLLLTGELRKMKPGRFLLFLGSALLPAALWAVCRFQYDGFTFFRNMYEADIAGRTAAGGLEGHGFPFSFYWTSIFWNFDYIYGWLSPACDCGTDLPVDPAIPRERFSSFQHRSHRTVSVVSGAISWIFRRVHQAHVVCLPLYRTPVSVGRHFSGCFSPEQKTVLVYSLPRSVRGRCRNWMVYPEQLHGQRPRCQKQ